MAYADYDFYLNTYFGNAVPEEDFPRLSDRASDYIRAAAGGREKGLLRHCGRASGRGGNDRRRLFRGTARLQ